jgi:uncharacterized membrane protein
VQKLTVADNMTGLVKCLSGCILLQKTHLSGLFLTFVGALLQQYYLLNVGTLSIWVLVISAVVMALGIFLSFGALDKRPSARNYALLSIYLMYFSLVIMPFVRFKPLSGNDMLYEFMAAQDTAAHGWNTFSSLHSWYVDASHIGYLTSASITILPVMINEITGLNLILVFKFVLSAIISLTPILIYLVVKEIFKIEKLAILSSIIFSEFYFSFWSVSIGGARQPIAILFILFALYTTAKLLGTNQRSRAYFFLVPFFLFGIVFSHYTMAYWSIVLFFSFVIISFASSKSSSVRNILKVNLHEITLYRLRLLQFVFAFFILSMVWYFTIPSSPVPSELQSIVSLFQARSTSAFGIVQKEYVTGGSPLGPWVDNWLRLSMILCILGFLYLLFKKKDFEVTLFFIGGGVFLLLTLVAFFIPNLWTLYGGFLRVYITGYFFLCTFVAIALLAIDKKLKGFLLPVFLMLSLSMGLLLPVHGHYVLYHPEATVSPTAAITQYAFKESEFEASVWAGNYIPTGQDISTDNRGYIIMAFANHPTIAPYVSYYGSSYLYLHNFAINNGLWQTIENVTSIDVNSIIYSNNVIYHDGNMLLTKAH